MELTEALEFLENHHHALLATLRRDGLPQLTPVTVALDGERRVVLSTRAAAAKTKNLRRDPRASLCVLQDGFFGPFVQLEGLAEVHELPGAMEGLIAYYRAAAGEHPDWAEYRAAMEREQRVLITVTVSRVGPNISG